MKMRYLIIDMEKVRSGKCNFTNPNGYVGLNIDLAILSEEDTIAKFKEIWDEGVQYGAMDGSDRFSDDGFQEFKEKL
jgi:hypothetical protein